MLFGHMQLKTINKNARQKAVVSPGRSVLVVIRFDGIGYGAYNGDTIAAQHPTQSPCSTALATRA